MAWVGGRSYMREPASCSLAVLAGSTALSGMSGPPCRAGAGATHSGVDLNSTAYLAI